MNFRAIFGRYLVPQPAKKFQKEFLNLGYRIIVENKDKSFFIFPNRR